MSIGRIKELLIKHELIKLKPYRCSSGFLTIGVGRNLDSRGITSDEALFLLNNDINQTKIECYQHFQDWYPCLSSVRQDVIINMVFNIGIPSLLQFKRMIKALKKRDYNEASKEMLDSKWARQVTIRADELSLMMKTGRY